MGLIVLLTPFLFGYIGAVVALVADERSGWGSFSQSLRYY